jgi:hypothetical protein
VAPLYPALMAAGAMIAPGRDPFLTAARALNVAAGAAALLLLFIWARPILGRWAAAASAWLAATSVFTVYTWAPICDIFFLVMILAVLVTRRGALRYILGALAALTRYEAIALVIIFGVYDAWETRSWKWLAYAAAASLPSALWLLVPVFLSRARGTYVDQYLYLKPSGAVFVSGATQVLFQTKASALGFLSYVAGVAAAAGLCYAGWKRRGAYAAAAVFFLVYIAAHAVWPWGFRRYFIPVLPLAVFGLWVAVVVCGRRLYRSAWLSRVAAALGWAGAAATLVGGVAWALRGGEEYAFLEGGLTLFLAAAVAVAAARPPRDWRRLGIGLLAVPVAAAFVAKSAAVAWDDYELEQAGVTLRYVAEYLDRVAPRADIATTSPGLLGYYLQDGERRLISVDRLQVTGYEDMTSKLREAGADYVVADGSTCGVVDVTGHRPAALAMQPLYRGKAGPPYRLVKVVTTRFEESLIYRLDGEDRPGVCR